MSVRSATRVRAMPRDDALVAAVLALASTVQVLLLLPIASRPVGAIVALVSTLPVAWRRSHPVAAALAGSAIWLVPTDGFVVLGYVAAFLLFYSVGAYVDDLRVVGAVSIFALAASAVAAAEQGLGIGEYAGGLLAVAAPVGVGRLVRRQRAQARRLELLAVHLEAERDRAAQAAVAEERARIARELHDIVSHSVSLIAVQSDAAEAALDRDPELVRRPLATIRATAGDALGELRRLLGVFRAADDEADRAPLPGLAQVPALVERARAAGLRIDLAIDGEPRPLARSADLSAYRIVQEALTNVRKHAPGAAATVELRWLDRSLEIHVADDGPGPPAGPPPDAAHGLVGMRERVRLHGGALAAGARAGGGFEVRAALPIEADP